MKTCSKPNIQISDRVTFTKEFNEHYLSITGYGMYSYFNPVKIDQFFNRYLNEDVPIRSFVLQCIVPTRNTSKPAQQEAPFSN
jgi:hypothetical protein